MLPRAKRHLRMGRRLVSGGANLVCLGRVLRPCNFVSDNTDLRWAAALHMAQRERQFPMSTVGRVHVEDLPVTPLRAARDSLQMIVDQPFDSLANRITSVLVVLEQPSSRKYAFFWK